jgi:D-sedoheptulose 7-phosphate isomerase
MIDRKEIIERAVREAVALKTAYTQQREAWLLSASDRLVEAFRSGHKVMIAGNGGSAADSQHFAAELVVRLTSPNNRPALPAIALTVDTSILTAAANDFGYDSIFSRQIEAIGREGDIFIGISTSGKSPNIMAAFRAARAGSIATLGLFGETGINDRSLCDLPLTVPSSATMRIQEEHIFVLHLLVELTEAVMFA